MSVRKILVTMVMTCFMWPAAFAGPCYALLGAGESTVRGVHDNGYESQIFEIKGVTGSSRVDGTSGTRHVGLGCDWGRYLSVRLGKSAGFRVVRRTTGSIHFSVPDKSYDIDYGLGTYSVSLEGQSVDGKFAFERFVEVGGTEVSAQFLYPLFETFKPYARLGVLVGHQYAGLSSNGITISQKEKGYLPIVGLGVRLGPGVTDIGQRGDWFAEIEKTTYTDGNKVSAIWFTIGFRFP